MANSEWEFYNASLAEQQAYLRQRDAERALGRHAAEARRFQDLVDRGVLHPDQVPQKWVDRKGENLLKNYKHTKAEFEEKKVQGGSSSPSGEVVVALALGTALVGGVFGINRANAAESSHVVKAPTATERSVDDPRLGLQQKAVFDAAQLPPAPKHPNPRVR